MRGIGLLVLLMLCSVSGCSDDQTRQASSDADAAAAPQPTTEANARDSEKATDGTEGVNPAVSEAVEDEEQKSDQSAIDQRYRQLVVGTWEDDYQGHRTMTLKADGTGTMIVELSGLQATLFAERLEFNMEWSLEDGRLKKRTIDGKPQRRVNMILKMMGDRVDEPILELTEDRLLLLDKDGETRYDWRRKK